MSPFPAIFTLQYSRVHISTSNSCDVFTNIETAVDKSLCPTTTLNVPNIYLNDRHVRLG